jgi:hypothetical protein
MHNRALRDTLAAFVEEAACQLAEEVSGGAEVPFELIEQGRRSSPLYCYRPLTGRFIAERVGMLARLPSHAAAVQGLAALPELSAYLRAGGRPVPSGDPRAQAEAALQALLAAVWGEGSDFAFDSERFDTAYAELEDVAYAGCSLSVVLTPVEGLVIESDEVPLGDGVALVRGVTLRDVPAGLVADAHATIAVLALETEAGDGRALESAGRRLRRLQTALRLWDDAEPALGPSAWARTDGGPWLAIPFATALRRPAADCLLSAEEEDPLRAFCSLVARRTPRGGELAWALRRFELGCERAALFEALTDWLLAARALLGEAGPEAHEGLAERLAVICAEPDDRERVELQVQEAVALERSAMRGLGRPDPEAEAVVVELGRHLRAILRDVLCGHLDPAVRRVADSLLADERQSANR